MGETILVVNAGSSSIKFQLFERLAEDRVELELKGQMEGIGTRPHLLTRDAAGKVLVENNYEPGQIQNVRGALDRLADWLVGPPGGGGPAGGGPPGVHRGGP